MSRAFRCGVEVCRELMPDWRIQRRGDAVVSWACDNHLARVCRELQREWEPRTELVVTVYRSGNAKR